MFSGFSEELIGSFSSHYVFRYIRGLSLISRLTLHAYAVNLIIVGGGDSTNNRLYEEVLEAGYKVGKQLDVLKCLTIVSYAYFIESAVFFVSCIIAARSIA